MHARSIQLHRRHDARSCRARGTRRAGPRDRRTGTSIRRPAARSGWSTRRSSDGIRGGRSGASAISARFGLFEDEWLRGGPVQRWMPKGLAGKPVFVFETGGTTGIPKTRVAFEDFRTDYELFSAHAARRVLPEGLELADARTVGSAAAAAGGRAPRAVPRRHLLLRRPRSALGHQADQERLERAPRGLQGPRHRSGGDDPPGRPRHPVHVHDAEAARSAGAPARVDGHDDPQGGHHRHLLGRNRVHAAVEPLRARGAARRRVHDADLRQHADGPGRERADRTAQRTTRSPTTRRSRAP